VFLAQRKCKSERIISHIRVLKEGRRLWVGRGKDKNPIVWIDCRTVTFNAATMQSPDLGFSADESQSAAQRVFVKHLNQRIGF
jgi:hypothetical protein